MSFTNKTVIGVCVDHSEALLIHTPDKSNDGIYEVSAKIHNKHHSDHTHSKNTHNHKKAQELHKYYDEISKQIQGYDAILLFGIGKAQEELKNYLSENKQFQGKNIIVKASDKLTHNETIAFVKKSFV